VIRQDLLEELDSLPEEAQRQVVDFIALLRQRYLTAPAKEASELEDLAGEEFIGMWRDRQDMADSTAWVRNLREKEWSRTR
jgi:hypothetical protein